jgi:hypothetical protein
LDNVFPIYLQQGNRLPFPDESLDLVCLNGVLEWVGASIKSLPPREGQLSVLREINRVLKSSGSLYIGIENRVGLKYFLGDRDEHSSLRWTTLLSRSVASVICRIHNKGEYRTYTYSVRGYKRLLQEAGFTAAVFFAEIPNYRKPGNIVPLKAKNCYRGFLRRRMSSLSKQLNAGKIILHRTMDCLNYLKYPYLINSLGIITQKDRSRENYLNGVLKEQVSFGLPGVSADTVWNFYSHSTAAWGKYGKVIFWGFPDNRKTPLIVCKITRNPEFNYTLDKAHNNLNFIWTSHSSLKEVVPEPLFLDTRGDYRALIEKAVPGFAWPARPLRKYFSPPGLKYLLDDVMPLLLEINGLETGQPDEAAKKKWIEEIEQAWSILVDDNEHIANSDRSLLAEARKKMAAIFDDGIPGVFNHNDFVPENILKTDRLIMMDWELAERMDIPLMDLLRFIHRFFTKGGCLSGQTLIDRIYFTPDEFRKPIAEAISLYSARFQLPKESIRWLIALYWLRMSFREYETICWAIEYGGLAATGRRYQDMLRDNRFFQAFLYYLQNIDRL